MEFSGFPEDVFDFFADLAANNDKAWFEANRERYEASVLEPSRRFVVALGRELAELYPGIHAEPKVNKSLFKIHRDVRFSKDKSPFKTHMGIWFWDGPGKRMECPGFYFHLEPGLVRAGSGYYQFAKEALAVYREMVDEDKWGRELEKIVADLQQAGFETGRLHYKRVPRGYPADHPRAELLKYNALYAGSVEPPGEFVHGPELIDYCLQRYRSFIPMHEWLKELLKRTLAGGR